MQIVYRGASDAVLIPALGVTVHRGEPFECPAAIAGRHPSDRWLLLQLVDIPAAVEARDHALRSLLIDELINEDPGDGLLAQWPHFTHPDHMSKKKAGGDTA